MKHEEGGNKEGEKSTNFFLNLRKIKATQALLKS